jgi:hypothetical protein
MQNAASRAWEQIIALTDRSHELRNYGVSSSTAPSPVERHLRGPKGFTLALKLNVNDASVSASILNESVPAGKLPNEREFKIVGDAQNPVLVEAVGDEWTVEDVFDQLTFWLRDAAL